jgi:hypothetical protein
VGLLKKSGLLKKISEKILGGEEVGGTRAGLGGMIRRIGAGPRDLMVRFFVFQGVSLYIGA